MPTPFILADISVPEGTEVAAFLHAHADLEPLRFRDEEFLIRHDDEDDQTIYLVLRGSCLIEYGTIEERQPGRELAILNAEPGQPVFVGEMCYLGTGVRSASVRSTMNTFAVRLRPDHLDRIIQHYPGLTRQLFRQFAQRLHDTLRQLQALREEQALDAQQVFLNAGDTLVYAGAPADILYQLVDGVLAREPEELIRSNSGELPFIDAAAYFRDGTHPTTITCRSGCILIAIGKEARRAVVRNFPDLVLEIL